MKKWFDDIPNRKLSGCRKWDESILEGKFHVDKNAIPMDIADIDFSVSPAILEAMVQRATIGDYSYTYVQDRFYDSVISWNSRRFQVELKKEWITLTYGTVSTLHHIVKCFCKEGESVLINTPAYDPFEEAILHGDHRMVCNPLVIVNGQYQIDFTLLRKQLKEENVSIYILCSPQNPSGRVWTKEELHRICELCLEFNVLLVCDEIHRDLVFDRASFTSLWNAHVQIQQHSIVCVSANKGFNLGGLKTSYVTIENEHIRMKLKEYLKKVQVTSPNVFAIPAYCAAYDKSEEWLDEMVAYVENNQRYIEKRIYEIFPRAHVMSAQSSFLTWIDFREEFSTEAKMEEFFIEANVTMVVGSYFVQDGVGWARLNVGTSKAILEEALDRLAEVKKKKDLQ